MSADLFADPIGSRVCIVDAPSICGGPSLGAQAWRVVRLVMTEGLRLVGIGAAAGMLLSLLMAQRLATIVPSAGWPSPWLWIATIALLAGAVAVASVIPARRALSADRLSLMRDM